MKKVEFIYRIEADVEFTGRELAVLYHCARGHYDHVCKTSFTVGGFGWGWLNQFLDGDESIISFDLDTIEPRFAERTVEVRATYREIDICAKILEVAQDFSLPEREGNRANLDAATSVFMSLPRLMREIREESQRLNGST
jgi:hypothetical protein